MAPLHPMLAKDTAKLHHVAIVRAAKKGAFPAEEDQRHAIDCYIDSTKRQKLLDFGIGARDAGVLDESIKKQADAQVELDSKTAKVALMRSDLAKLATTVIDQRDAFESKRAVLQAELEAVEQLRARGLSSVSAPDLEKLEREASNVEELISRAQADLHSSRMTLESAKADLARETVEAKRKKASMDTALARERPRREQLSIMSDFCRSKTMLLEQLSGLRLVVGDDGAVLDDEGQLTVRLAGEGKHSICIQFHGGKVASCTVSPWVTGDGTSERLASSKAVRDDDAAGFISHIRRLLWSARTLKAEIKSLEDNNTKQTSKWARYVLAYKPTTRVVTILFAQGSYQANLLLPVDYPAAPAQLVDFQDLVKFKSVDSILDKVKQTLGAVPTVTDWVSALQKEVCGKR